MVSKNVIFTGLFVVAIAASAFGQGKRDVIRLKDDSTPKEVEILEEDYKGISLVKRGEYPKAWNLLREFKDKKNLPKVYRQHALFYLAQTLESLSPPKLEGAISNYRQLLSEFRQSRYLAKANSRIVACLVARGEFGEAHKALNSARKKAVKDRMDEKVLRQLDFLGCTLLENEEKFVEATNCYERLAAAAASNPEVADLALIGSARSLVRKGGNSSTRKRAILRRWCLLPLGMESGKFF